MNLNLTGKNALVGGSSKGIGWATAVELAELGASVTLVSRSEEHLQKRVKELPANGKQPHNYVCVDYKNIEEVEGKVKELLSGRPIHILVNNTGGPSGGNIIDEPTEKFEEIFRQHLSVNQLLTQLMVPGMIDAGFGRIVNIISVSVKQPIVGLGVSNTIRWAVASWAKTLSKEIAKNGITVNNVLPGYTKTGRLEEVNELRAKSDDKSVAEVEKQLLGNVPTGRFATPEETAAAVAFLCSPAAASINGINLPVDGGLSNSL